MSTRSTTHFHYGEEKKPTAIIYRHSDGYPAGAGVDILTFLDECAKLKDSRFGDPSYLAARYVVFLADMFNNSYNSKTGEFDQCDSRLDFISVGVMDADPGDIEYRYVIRCKEGRPKVTCYEVSGKRTESPDGDWRKCKDLPQSKWKLTEVAIPTETLAGVR